MLGRISQSALSAGSLASPYLRIVGISCLFMSISHVYLCTMRSIERVLFAAITNGSALGYLHIMLSINMYSVLGQAMNTTVICGIFRSGGDSRRGFICDFIDMWFFAVPLGFLSAFVLKLPPMWVYFLIYLDEFVKLPFVYRHYKSNKWLQNITREFS